jgi:phenylpropionate dioxygenase-like ring-hydroxylating dioxygenase large terminal subunit
MTMANPETQSALPSKSEQASEPRSYEHLLRPEHYRDERFYVRERESIFANTWQLVATLDELPDHNDFVTVEVAERPLVIQNVQGEMRAFENVCSHRFARIRAEPKGNGPLVCSYHGFCYDQEGCATPPALLKLRLSKEELDGMRLRRYPVRVCGNFVFVHLSANPTESLQEYLAATAEHLLVCSRGMGDHIDTQAELVEANWKIVVENFLEFAHIPRVHAPTFGRIGLDGSAGVDIAIHGLHSSGLLKANQQRLASANPKEDLEYMQSFQARPHKHMGSSVYLMFPNLVTVSVFGLSYLITSVHPWNRHQTLLQYRLFEAQPDAGATIRPELRHKRREVLKAFAYKTVIEEDKSIVEQIQTNIKTTRKAGVLGGNELRLRHFHENVLSRVSH